MIGIYIHIPFCIKKCNYCDFNSQTLNKDVKNKYINALINEMRLYKEKMSLDVFDSVFLGGGTPSILDEKDIEKIMTSIYANFNLKKDAEISIECNPGTLTESKLKTMKNLGINRISIGLQSTHEQHLKALGRIHTFEEFKTNYNMAREIGFNNINIDLMFGYENQTLKEWKDTLCEIISLNPAHISAYSLIIEEGTKFGDLYNQGLMSQPDEDLQLNMYYYLREYLAKYGYHQYEISNFSKRQYECIHNKIYWKCENYLGLGVSAHSYINSIRYSNTPNIDDYVNSIKNDELPIIEKNILTDKDKIEEKIIMGLRMNEGIDIKEINNIFSIDFETKYEKILENLQNNKLIKVENGKCMLTNKGIDISNSVFIEFLD